MTDSPHLKNSSLSLPCTIREPGKEILLGVIKEDLGDRFLVYIPSTNFTNSISKLFVYPDFGITAKPIPPTKKVTPPSKDSPLRTRRKQGEGTGYIECKPIKRSGKEYKQYWYHYEEWEGGDCTTKKSKYIPKWLVARVEKMEAEKAPVRDILVVLGVKG